MGHTVSIDRAQQLREPAGVALAQLSSYTPAPMQALYLSGGRPDMAFMSNHGRMPAEFPEVQQTHTVKTHVNLNKASLKLKQSMTNSQKYALEFRFDATKPCRIRIYFLATETIDIKTGSSSFELIYSNKIPLLKQQFLAGVGQLFKLNGNEEDAAIAKVEDHEEHEQPLPLLDFSLYNPDELVYKADTTQFPLIIVLEVLSDKKRLQSQATFCAFMKNKEDAWAIRLLKQEVLVDGLTYNLQEIYGINGSVTATSKTERGRDGQADASPDEDEIDNNEGAECIICLCEPRVTTVLPCRHMCLCSECAETLRKSSSTCPICRTRVESLLQIRSKRNHNDALKRTRRK